MVTQQQLQHQHQQEQQQINNDPPLERSLSWQDIRDAPSLSSPRLSSAEDSSDGNHNINYRYADSSNRKYQKPPLCFSITLVHIDGDARKKTCHPGSIFEGTVNLKLEWPLAAQHLKLIFKGAERIHSDAVGKANKKSGERLFAIRTVLWGLPSHTGKQWPVIEAGEHQFPFMCEVPMVNYPPTFRHHLVSCEFELIACLERPGIRPFQTLPYPIRYEPFILSTPIKTPDIYQEKMRLSNSFKVLVTLLQGCHYNLLDPHTTNIKIQLSIVRLTLPNKKQAHSQHGSSSTALLNHIEAVIKREIDVTHGAYHRFDTMVMSHVEQSTFGVGNPNGARTYYINMPIPTELNHNNSASITKNFDVFGMTTTIDFSKHIKMNYKLYITAKVRNGLISTRRQLFCIPLYFGTVASGDQLPSSLVSYRDPEVTADTTLATKPKFIKPFNHDEQLPAYNEDDSPPSYCHQGSNDSSDSPIAFHPGNFFHVRNRNRAMNMSYV